MVPKVLAHPHPARGMGGQVHHRLGVFGQPAQHPVDLRSVHRRQVHHRDPHCAALVPQLGDRALGEADDRVLGAAVRRLQGNAPIGQGRPDLDDHAGIARLHVPQRGPGAVDLAEVGGAGGPLEPLRRHLGERREEAAHRVC
jgi:hypothetical protein